MPDFGGRSLLSHKGNATIGITSKIWSIISLKISKVGYHFESSIFKRHGKGPYLRTQCVQISENILLCHCHHQIKLALLIQIDS